jgi:hypothetical protein
MLRGNLREVEGRHYRGAKIGRLVGGARGRVAEP